MKTHVSCCDIIRVKQSPKEKQHSWQYSQVKNTNLCKICSLQTHKKKTSSNNPLLVEQMVKYF